MKQEQKQKLLMSRLGHDFKDPDLLSEALTHSSLSSPTRRDNQRLEFLGDRVLGLVIAEALLGLDKTASEGDLAPRFNTMVRKETCAEIAMDVKLGDALMLGRSEMLSGGRRKKALLGDAMEAVIAAVYMDAGFAVTSKIIRTLWAKRLSHADEAARDGKTMLQEWAQARGMLPPDYAEVTRSGPDHAPIFTIKVTLEDGQTATAQANSKRAGQQAAATALLESIEHD